METGPGRRAVDEKELLAALSVPAPFATRFIVNQQGDTFRLSFGEFGPGDTTVFHSAVTLHYRDIEILQALLADMLKVRKAQMSGAAEAPQDEE